MLPETLHTADLLQPGKPAPAFDLPDADMNPVSLTGFRNRRNVVLYFYPRDDTPGCTMEAIEFSEKPEAAFTAAIDKSWPGGLDAFERSWHAWIKRKAAAELLAMQQKLKLPPKDP